MAELVRNSKENTIEIYQGFHRSKFYDDMKHEKVKDSDITLLTGRKKIEGIKISSFFETTEIASFIAENDLRKIFERKQYKCVYTGNFIQMSDRSPDFYLNIGKTRPDFLVKVPNIGMIFIDVKCRKLYEIGGDYKAEYFNLNKEEVNELLSVQNDMDIPVWIAVKDFGKFSASKKAFSEPDFYFISLTVLNSFIKKMNSKNGSKSGLFYSYKVPVGLFRKDNKLLTFSFDDKFDKETVDMYSDMMLNSVDEIKEAIIKAVGSEEFYKTYLPYVLSGYYPSGKTRSKFNGMLSHLTPQDINSVLWKMIDDGQIVHAKGKPLSVKQKKK
jgi:hypothetical protein